MLVGCSLPNEAGFSSVIILFLTLRSIAPYILHVHVHVILFHINIFSTVHEKLEYMYIVYMHMN